MFRRLPASFASFASLVAVLAVSLLALGLGRPALAGSWENLDEVIQKRGSIVIGIGYSTPPMNYLDDQGRHAGFDVDLAKALAERMHLKYTVVKVNNKTRITSLSGGETDMVLSNMNRTMSRARQIDFSDIYLLDGKRILAPKGLYKDLKDFVGKRIAVCQGSNAQQAVAQAHLAHIRDGVRVALHQATRQPGLHVCRCHCLWDTDAQRRGLSCSSGSRGHTAPYRTGREWQPRRPPSWAVRD